MACYIPRWYIRPKSVTHPSTNRARRALTSFMPNAANHYATPPTNKIDSDRLRKANEILWCQSVERNKILKLGMHEFKFFLKSVNVLQCRMKHFSDEMVIVHLIKSYCQPLIIYACESFHSLRSEISHSSAGPGIAYFGVFLKLVLRIYSELYLYSCWRQEWNVELNCRSVSSAVSLSCSPLSVVRFPSILASL